MMRIRSTAARLAMLGALTIALTGCTGASDGTVPPPAPAPTPSPSEPVTPADPDEGATDVVAVYVVRSAPTTFFVEPIPVDVAAFDDATDAHVTAAVAALLGLTATGDEELSTSVPPGTTLRDVSIDRGVVTLDLSGAIVGSSGSSAQELTFAQQLAHTARVDASIEAIVLLVEGRPVDELWGHLDWSRPIAIDPFMLSPVTIAGPLPGAEVPVGPVTFRGEATVFEATVLVTLLDVDGEVLEEGFVTATTGAPERGTWEWTVTLPGPGEFTVVAAESDPSEGEGRPPFATSRTVRAG